MELTNTSMGSHMFIKRFVGLMCALLSFGNMTYAATPIVPTDSTNVTSRTTNHGMQQIPTLTNSGGANINWNGGDAQLTCPAGQVLLNVNNDDQWVYLYDPDGTATYHPKTCNRRRNCTSSDSGCHCPGSSYSCCAWTSSSCHYYEDYDCSYTTYSPAEYWIPRTNLVDYLDTSEEMYSNSGMGSGTCATVKLGNTWERAN